MSTKGRLKRTSPVLLLLGVLVIGAVAIFIPWWQSGVVEHSYEYHVEGMSGKTIQLDPVDTISISNYIAGIEATDLSDFNAFSDSVILAFDGGNVNELSSGLSIGVDVVLTGQGSGDVTVTASATYIVFYHHTVNLDDFWTLTTKPGFDLIVGGDIQIPFEDIEYLTYDSTLPGYTSNELAKVDGNCIIIQFNFSHGGSDWGDYMVDADITFNIGVDDGT